MAKHSPDPIWIKYRDSLLLAFFAPADPSDFESKEVPPEKYWQSICEHLKRSDNLNDAVKMLKGLVTQEKIEQLRVRYRSYKYRVGKSKKTLQIEEATHDRIMMAKKELHFDSVDEALHHLISPNYARGEYAAERQALADMPFDIDAPYLTSLLNRLSRNDREMLLLALERAFMDGWSSAKASSTKKPDARSKATSAYLAPFDTFRVNGKEKEPNNNE